MVSRPKIPPLWHIGYVWYTKTLSFDDGVNVTLGLPFIRTSPDHGTALDIAGTGVAKPNSFIAALKMAAQMRDHTVRKFEATS